MKHEMFAQELTVLRDTFRRLIRRHAHTNILRLISKTHPADLAHVFRVLSEQEQSAIFDLMVPSENTADFLNELDESVLTSLLKGVEPKRIAAIIVKGGANIQARILALLPEEDSKAVLDLLKAEAQEEVEEIMGYPKDSAGAMMDTDVFSLPETTLAGDSIKTLQDHENAPMAFYLYVTDEEKRLVGVISLRDLVTTPPDTELRDIMVRNVQAVSPETDQEVVARVVARYNYLAVPVVDLEGRLLGIVPVEEVVDVIREEATEDFLQMAGVGRDREILLKSAWGNVKSRIPWLFATLMGGVLASMIIGEFQGLLAKIVALAAFIPVITGMGGNIGNQASTIVVRGLATGRVFLGSTLKIVLKEMKVGILLGLICGIILGAVVHIRFIDESWILGLVVGLSICASMVLAATVGTIVPLLLKRLDIDPAIATGPFVSTTVDILGVLIYFSIATALL